MTQDFGCITAQGKLAHSRLRNCFSSAAGSKGKSGSGIIELSFVDKANTFWETYTKRD